MARGSLTSWRTHDRVQGHRRPTTHTPIHHPPHHPATTPVQPPNQTQPGTQPHANTPRPHIHGRPHPRQGRHSHTATRHLAHHTGTPTSLTRHQTNDDHWRRVREPHVTTNRQGPTPCHGTPATDANAYPTTGHNSSHKHATAPKANAKQQHTTQNATAKVQNATTFKQATTTTPTTSNGSTTTATSRKHKLRLRQTTPDALP